MITLNVLNNFFYSFLVNISKCIGSFYSVIMLSVFIKLILYQNQIDNLNNMIKRELVHTDLDILLIKYRYVNS
ncbi:Uncharacterised protein [Staphylococcus saccharolyticus]|uniref:Uncharacterized protein n=1 Tax=Staphylococcus saccharolyticus TaxID=33028 RepID=A0A380HB52_9STAP|nr:Uncharacterised protein [Staphylococcus saccharolyticus]